MKNIIVTIGEILLGVIIFGLIFGGGDSTLQGEVTRIFEDVITQTGTVHN